VDYLPFLTAPGPACGGAALPTATPYPTPTLIPPSFTPSVTRTPSRTPSDTPEPSSTPSPMTLLPSDTPSLTPTLTAADYSFSFVDFQANGVVHYQIANDGPVPVTLSGFALEWAHDPSAAPLDMVSAGGTSAFDPASVVIWDGSDLESPTGATSGRVPGWRAEAGYDPGWLAEVVIPAGETLALWFDFDGTTGRLDTDLGYSTSDLAGATLTLAEAGTIELEGSSTPLPTDTPTMTFTPSWTPLPTATPTRTPSRTPRPTDTPNPAYAPPGGCVSLNDAAGTILCTQ